MTDVFVDRIVERLLKTYTTKDMTIIGLMDDRYQDLMRELKYVYRIRTYGQRSKIRKEVEKILMIRNWVEYER
jgi:hypothetical protein